MSATKPIAPPSWIYPGAKVLLVFNPGSNAETYVVRTEVKRVSKLTFSVNASDIRISLLDLKGREGGSIYSATTVEVVDAFSERGSDLWRTEVQRRIRQRARNLATQWATADPTNVEKLDELISALNRWRAVVQPT